LLGKPNGHEEDDATDDQHRVQDEHRAHDVSRFPLEGRLLGKTRAETPAVA
jgi:hypothetical protein